MVFFFVFFWLMFIMARLFIFAARIDIKIKKVAWPIVIVALGAAMLSIGYFFHLPNKVFYALLPITALIVFVNLRGFYFCDKCERMIAHKDIFKKPEKCGKCGAHFKPLVVNSNS